MVRSKLAAKEGVLEYVVCCAAARCMLRAATIKNLCEAKLIFTKEFEANLKSNQIRGDVVFYSIKNTVLCVQNRINTQY